MAILGLRSWHLEHFNSWSQILISLRKNTQKESRLLNLGGYGLQGSTLQISALDKNRSPKTHPPTHACAHDRTTARTHEHTSTRAHEHVQARTDTHTPQPYHNPIALHFPKVIGELLLLSEGGVLTQDDSSQEENPPEKKPPKIEKFI